MSTSATTGPAFGGGSVARARSPRALRRLRASRGQWAVLATAAGLLPLAPGCRTAPQRLDAVNFNDPAEVREASDQFWRVKRPVELSPGSNIALVDFGVEFVTQKDEGPFESQLLINPPLILTVAERVVPVVGKEQTIFTDETREATVQTLFDIFVREASVRSIEVVPPEESRMAQAFQPVTIVDPKVASTFKIYELFPNDTGKIYQTEFETLDGLTLVKEPKGQRCAKCLVSVAEQTQSAATLVVRLRVGTTRGRASIERGSKVWLISDDRVLALESRRSLISDPIEASTDQFLGGALGQIYTPPADAYVAQIATVATPYISMLLGEAFELTTETALAVPDLADPGL